MSVASVNQCLHLTAKDPVYLPVKLWVPEDYAGMDEAEKRVPLSIFSNVQLRDSQ